MGIFYVGDIHGRVNDFYKVIQIAESKNISAIIQVGDFGIGFPDKNRKGSLDDFIKKRGKRGKWKVPIFTCAGNHDNHDFLDQISKEQNFSDKVEIYPNSGVYFVPRGNCLEIDGITHLFLGGAESTDKQYRIEGSTWWAREEPSISEFEKFFASLESLKPDTVITHDAPLRVELSRARRDYSYTPNMLENVLKHSEYHPKRWYFGHHHLFEKWKYDRTKFYCCGLHGQYWHREFHDI